MLFRTLNFLSPREVKKRLPIRLCEDLLLILNNNLALWDAGLV